MYNIKNMNEIIVLSFFFLHLLCFVLYKTIYTVYKRSLVISLFILFYFTFFYLIKVICFIYFFIIFLTVYYFFPLIEIRFVILIFF